MSDTDHDLGAAFLLNDTDIPIEDISTALSDSFPNLSNRIEMREMSVLTRWGNDTQGRGRDKTIFSRDRYVTPKTIFDQFRTAADAAHNDDVVAGVLETTEQLAFKRVAMESDDKDEEWIWNKVVDDLDLETRMREIWRELFTISQCYVASIWGRKNFKVGGKTKHGNKKKKEYKNVLVPIGLTLLDPLKVIPVGNFMFGQEKLVYIADRHESQQIDETLAGPNTSDLVVNQLLKGKYEPSKTELGQIVETVGNNIGQFSFYLLDPDRVWRITSTRPAYQRFANVRMNSVFELLDLKHLLREMDRAHIIGGTNFIILVKKGSDKLPAKPQELAELAAQMRTSSRVPIIVGDNRLDIEIITPKLDHTLQPERYNALDSRITSRLYQVLNTGNYSSGTANDDSVKLVKVIAASMEARRDNIRDALMDNLFDQMYERNDEITEEPKMMFFPRRIALDFDPNIATYLLELRDRGEVSRETLLAEYDIVESDEARKREVEAELYDKIFKITNVPFSSTAGQAPGTAPGAKAAARSGGRTGGGANAKSTKSSPARGPAKSKATEEDDDVVDED